MEIRNALQKIENYLTVVSNLNKTILSEGTMSRDELLLMKKYLYTSIDRIEDIERMPVIENIITEDFAFTDELEDFSKTNKEEVSPMIEVKSEHEVEEKSEVPLVNKINEETIASKFEETKPLTFAEQLANAKKEETS